MIIAWFFQKDQQSNTSFYSLIICSGPIATYLHVIVGFFTFILPSSSLLAIYFWTFCRSACVLG